MSNLLYRNGIIERIKKELIGPGSDVFLCADNYHDEIIDSKPLQRYFSGILFPKQKSENEDDGLSEFSEDISNSDFETQTFKDSSTEELEKVEPLEEKEEEDEADTVSKANTNTFFPSHFGFSLCVSKAERDVDINVRFGNYRKAKHDEIALSYEGSDVQLLEQFGFNEFVEYDAESKTLRPKLEIRRAVKGQVTEEYANLQNCFKAMAIEHRWSGLFKYLQKIFFRSKYKRSDNVLTLKVNINDLSRREGSHLKVKLADIPGANVGNWHKDNREHLFLHIKLTPTSPDKYFIKVVLENTYAHKKDQFSLSKEKLNALAIFQVEIEAISEHLQPFRGYKSTLYKTEEDRMLDYLFRDKVAFGIGHNTSCTWENCEKDRIQPTWIKTTFLPAYSVKSQSTETDKIAGDLLNIKSLSSFSSLKKEQIVANLEKVSDAYRQWIKSEAERGKDNEFAKKNIDKCKSIQSRIERGIKVLSDNEKVYQAFLLANAAIYIQMFQSEWHFGKRDGFEVYERHDPVQHTFENYGRLNFPNDKKEPSWRPFQLAFILQCIPSFVDSDSGDRELVDLLYFPTGGGKTEAYLAVSAFLIFWRRLNHPGEYDGVNIIIRYTLRLLSAQQFERASKLIFAADFIRKNNESLLGKERISIGFWIGNATIPNHIEKAKQRYNFLLKKLNTSTFDAKKAINPFQITNCQWCNTKIISKIKEADKVYSVGHRVDKALQSFCLNPQCYYCESNGGFPIVLVDDDIYEKPPTILFGTVDKFASLAWNDKSSNLFNYKNNRKPELIIQDELHLLNGPLGSLVGLFENVIISLCSTENQIPKVIASTATVKNVESQIFGLYGRQCRVFPQYATNSDDTFFSKTLEESKRKYIGVFPTGKTSVMTNLQLLSSLFFARLEIFEKASNKADADQYWTILSYFKSLKEIGRFSNKISSELKPSVQQMQVRHLKNFGDLSYNYRKLPWRNLELTSRIPNERIKRNLDKLEIAFNGSLKDHKAFDFVLATNMISVGLDVGRLGIMVMNGMPPNTAEYIQASSRVARKNEGLVATMLDPFNTRDLSYYEDFVQFHKTFYKQVEPLSVTPFASSALDKMLFTLMIAYFRHKMLFAANDKASTITINQVKSQLRTEFPRLFENHPAIGQDFSGIIQKVDALIQGWSYKAEAVKDIKFYWYKHPKESLMKPLQERINESDVLVAMQSMRSVEPNAEIQIKQQ